MPIEPMLVNPTSKMPSSLHEGKIWLVVFGFACLVSSNSITVASEVHEAHTHGLANLVLVSINGTLEVQLESPAMSLLGFEHKAKNKEQLRAIEKTKEILRSPENVLSINGANCTTNRVDVEIHGPVGQSLRDSTKKHGNHNHEEDDDDHGASHSEVLATYRFDCAEGKEIQSISIALFEKFPRFETIKVNWVTETQQGQSTLRPISPTIEFK